MDDEVRFVEEVPSIGFSYSVQVGDGRSLVAQTHIPQTWSISQANDLIDKLRSMADRQVKFGKLEALDHEIDLQDRLVKQLRDGLEAVDKKAQHMLQSPVPSGSRRKTELPAAEVQARKNAVVSLEQTERNRMELAAKREQARAALEG